MSRAKAEGRTVTEVLKAAIAASGHSLTRLAAASGVSQAQLSRFVRGERGLNGHAIDKLCVALNLELVQRLTPVAPPRDGDG